MSATHERTPYTSPLSTRTSRRLTLLVPDTPDARHHSEARPEPLIGESGETNSTSRTLDERVKPGLDVWYVVNRLLAEGDDTEDTLIRVCGAIRDSMEWNEVAFWSVGTTPNVLRSPGVVDTRSQAIAPAMTPLRCDCPSGRAAIPLIDHVFATGQPTGMSCLADTARTAVVSATTLAIGEESGAGAMSAYAFPVRGTHGVLGAIVCRSDTPRSTDATLLRLTSAIGARVGRFIERQRARERLHTEPAMKQESLSLPLATEPSPTASQLATVVDAIDESALVFDAQARILHVNLAYRSMLGYEEGLSGFTTTLTERERLLFLRDVSGRPITDEHAPSARILRGETLSSRNALEATARMPDGRDIQVRVSGAPIIDATGHLIGGVLVIRPVNDRARPERPPQDDKIRAEEILGIAAHDLRTPLASSRGYVQLAAMRLNQLAADVRTRAPALISTIELLRQNLAEADNSTRRLSRLVDRLLDPSRIQADKLDLQLDVVDLAEIVRAGVQEQRIATPARDILFNRPQSARAVPVRADPDRIGQVLLNYLSNALKYSPETGKVVVTLKVSHKQARISVRDEGQGIPAVEQARVWRRFEQLENTQRSGSGSGLGLGLYISRAIVEAHGGRVGVESVVGYGATFWFSLPVCRRIG